MRKLWNTKFILALASCIGILNVCYLHIFVTLNGNANNKPYDQLQTSLGFLRRQIASVDPGLETEQRIFTASGYNYLELLNLDIKDAFDRYQTSKHTIAKQYKDILEKKFELFNQTKEERSKNVHVEPSCTKKPFLLILVHSNPEHFLSREAIRLTWGRQENAINQGTWTSPDR